MMKPTRSQTWMLVVVLLFTAALYAPSLRFGFIWDDPLWFGRVVDKPMWTLLKPMSDYQFYRPATLLVNRMFARPDGTFPAVAMHAFQIGIHLLNVAFVFRLCGDLRVPDPIPLVATALFALYPLSHQAVAWTAPQQSWVMALMLFVACSYVRARRRADPWLLGASLLSYLLALFVQESALQILPFLFLLERPAVSEVERPAVSEVERPAGGGFKALWRSKALWLFVLLTLGYLALWSQMPRQEGFTGIAFKRDVARYLLQGIVFPVLGFPGGFPQALRLYVDLIVAAAIGGLVVLLLFQRQHRLLLWGLLWYVVALFPTWAGLRFAYVSLTSRLFYLSAFGAALLWAAALFPPARTAGRFGRLRRGIGWASTGLILLQSALLIGRFNAMYGAGASHIAELLDVLRDRGDQKLLFFNFPDRYALRRAPYPQGYWGVILAPVSVRLGQFARLVYGHEPTTDNLSVLAIGHPEREAAPYQFDLRGSPVLEPAAYARALAADAVYLTVYRPDGTMRLDYVGDVSVARPQEEKPLARFGDVAELLGAKARSAGGQVAIELRWRSLGPGAQGDIAFIHLVRADIGLQAQADGPPGRGLFPLWTWQPGHVVEEVRPFVPLYGTIPPGRYEVYVGLFNLLTQRRLPARQPDGTSLPDEALWVGQVDVE